MGGVPTMIGEFGIPYDMQHREAYHTNNFTMQERALSLYYDALDAHLVHSTQW